MNATAQEFESQAKFPNCPKGMTEEQYSAFLAAGQCINLLTGQCSQPCAPVVDGFYEVDFDHCRAKSKGGKDTGWNLQPMCSNINRWEKRDGEDSRYSIPSYFDQKIDPDQLRPNQYTHGYQLVKTVYRGLFECPDKELLRAYLLLAWIVGSGKTIGMVSILHAINEAINATGQGQRRIKKVLWLVHHQDLVESIKDEVENEPYKYGIVGEKPTVKVVKKATDWDDATTKADFVFACTQSLWGTKKAALTTESRAAKLHMFEAVIIDECQYAVEQYAEIFMLAPRALKFVVSATPMDAQGRMLSRVQDGRYRHLFRLFSVFGYESAKRHSKSSAPMLKEVATWEKGIENGYYIPVSAGKSKFVHNGEIVDGENNTELRHNNPRENAIVRHAIDAANSITAYPAHVMVRCHPTSVLKAMMKEIKGNAEMYFGDAPGWGVNAIYSGSPGISISNKKHPWMIGKQHGGMHENTERLLMAVDMGQFGLNNPYCGVVAWTHANLSLIELVQRIGRAIRIIPGIPESLQHVYLVFRDDERVQASVRKAIDYIRDMEKVVYSEFLSLDEVVERPVEICIPNSVQPIPSNVKFNITELVGRLLPNALSEEDLQGFVNQFESLDEDEQKQLRESIQAYSENLLDEKFKDQQFGLPESAFTIQVVFEEEAKEVFSEHEMISFAKSRYAGKATLPGLIERIQAKDPITVEVLSKELHVLRNGFHQPSKHFFPVQTIIGIEKHHRSDEIIGLYPRLTGLFESVFANAGKDYSTVQEIVASSLRRSIKYTFGLESTSYKVVAPFEAQLSSAMLSPLVQTRILSQARAMIINELRTKLPGHYALYTSQISAFLEAMGNEKDD